MERANQLKHTLDEYGIIVLRTKVEGRWHNTAAPRAVTGTQCYFEVHFKVEVASDAEWQRLAVVCAPFGAHLFHNSAKSKAATTAVVTLRRYNTTTDQMWNELRALVATITDAGYYVNTATFQHEYSLHDDNVGIDQGWLFKDSNRPTEFFVKVPV
jgi:hypothetical protein